MRATNGSLDSKDVGHGHVMYCCLVTFPFPTGLQCHTALSNDSANSPGSGTLSSIYIGESSEPSKHAYTAWVPYIHTLNNPLCIIV